MNVEIRDVEAVQAIRPVDAALYLRAQGWRQQAQTNTASVWLRTVGGDEFEAVLPMDVELRDYALRMGDLLGVLSVSEGRSQWQVYNDLLTITSDVLRIRIADPELTDGTLPLEEHAQIAQRTRDLVVVAACAASERRAVFHKRKPAQVMDHVRRVRIGQSERGSYVITVMSRVTPLLHGQHGQLFEADTPYERQVMQTLAQSLQALDRAVQEAAVSQQMAAFDRAIPQGVSANLCEAVVGLWGGDDLQRSLDFTFSWSPARPAPPNAIQRVALSSDRIPVIREAARQLREREPVPDFELRGPVTKLERQQADKPGEATIIGLVDDRPARVRVQLADQPYHQAVQAHDQDKSVRVFGTLAKEGRGLVLRDPRDLSIVDE